jgi:hypothetical protein
MSPEKSTTDSGVLVTEIARLNGIERQIIDRFISRREMD